MTDDFADARKGGRRTGGVPCAELEAGEPWQPTPTNSVGTERVSRRGFLQGAALLASLAAAPGAQAQAAKETPPQKLSLTINGKPEMLDVDTRTTLLDLLRERLDLTGTKKGCNHGQCGSCTVLANGRRINACLSLALSYQGQSITTIEGLANGEQLHPVQQAFLDHDGYQCGYCTPGQIVSAVATIEEAKKGQPSQVTRDLGQTGPIELTPEEIKERMSGNICRCGAYPGIVAAVRQAAGAQA